MKQFFGGRKCTDHSGAFTSGFWCKKTIPTPQVQSNPRNIVPYTLGDPHFIIAAVSANTSGDGIIFQTSHSDNNFASQLVLSGGRPQARCTDEAGTAVTLTAPGALTQGAPTVLTFTSAPGAQRFRVNSAAAGSASATFAATMCNQMMIGWGFQQFYPQPGFGGNVFAVVTGKGAPSAAELQVIESYLAKLAST